jgi:1-acyl-sn-glycerol-3-phosphate acyltransferase
MSRILKKKVAEFLLVLMGGWKTADAVLPEEGGVVIFYPHTSNWDTFYYLMYGWHRGVRYCFLSKKELFFFPLKYLLTALGSSPTGTRINVVDTSVEFLRNYRPAFVVITPEGTRRKVTRWRKGFYRIAMDARVPICLGFADYETKTVGIVKTMRPTGDFNEDYLHIRQWYTKHKIAGKYRELMMD